MTLPNLTSATPVNMKNHPPFSEQWLEDMIVEDPSLLGLGELEVIQRQKSQPTGGRLDLLLENVNTTPPTRYEVELQLGATDPSHIIRTIEYWDVENARYPLHKHIAVIVAEDVTTRFLNVMRLFNKSIPLIAIKMQCVQVDGKYALIATRVLDWVPPAIEEEDGGEQADENSWDAKCPETMPIFHKLLQMVKGVDPEVEPNYRKAHISLRKQGKVSTAIGFYPQKHSLKAWFKTSQDQALTDRLDEAGLYIPSSNQEVYDLRIRKGDLDAHEALLAELIRLVLEPS
ncbi:MAG: hypothetical protein F4W95_05355 [Chloroflexi bacterium]|nr:hypothetical protein [Chloroflexota bacterium]